MFRVTRHAIQLREESEVGMGVGRRFTNEYSHEAFSSENELFAVMAIFHIECFRYV